MAKAVAQIQTALEPDNEARWIAHLWDTYNNQRSVKMADWSELKKYLYATDTRTTSNGQLPWKNSTTLPKLTQIRDNLHSNYNAGLFPNDKWLQWQAYSKESARIQKARTITSYMQNKVRESFFETETSKLILDYIDYGNAFAKVVYERSTGKKDNGDKTYQYIGPRVIRISPEDIVFNPMATSFKESFKVVRSTTTIGELVKRANSNPDDAYLQKFVEHRANIRDLLSGYNKDDWNKSTQYSVDGFGSLYEYYMGLYVEVLEFYGDYYNPETGDLQENRVITIVDRCKVLRNEEMNTDSGYAPIHHVGWRTRSDNLWAMGPLDNLVGMQYRIDHLENLKADAMDLIVHPPLKIIGEVEQFIWAPGVPIHIDENGDVVPLSKELNSIVIAENQIQALMDQMELMAGAPREAMGVRSPGEKTAFEVQTLDNAAGRIFQEKIKHFEINLIEPVLNDMLEMARKYMDGTEVIRVVDNSLGVQKFREITKEDIVGSGSLRPVGARHFSQQATELQNIIGIANSPLWATLQPHVSGIQLSEFVNDITNLRGYDIFRPNVAVTEQQETQGLMNQAGEELEVQAGVPAEPEVMPEDPSATEGAPV
jgi:hypothetical protein